MTMTRSEWAQVMQRYAANWPRHPLPDLSAAKFYDDLSHLSAQQVTAALEAVFRSGREFPPTSAHILDEIAQQTVDAPPFREAWNLLLAGIRSKGAHRPDEVVAYVAQRSPAVAVWATHVDLREIGNSDDGDTTVYAQNRQHYENVIRRQQRAVTHGGLPSAAVPALRPGSAGLRPAGGAVAALAAALTAADDQEAVPNEQRDRPGAPSGD